MTGQRVWMAALAVMLAGALAACGKTAPENKKNEQTPAKPALAVNVAHLAQQIWPRVATASGAVQPWQEASIGAEVNGLKLAEVLVNVGDVVKQGQLLARLSDETVRAELPPIEVDYGQEPLRIRNDGRSVFGAIDQELIRAE